MIGVALLALFDNVFPGEIDMKTVDQNAHHDNLEKAFNLFEERLGVQQLLRPEDVTGKHETKNGNVTYILQIRNAVSKLEEDRKKQKELDEAKKNDKESKREAENNEHNNNGDRLYKQGLTTMSSTVVGAEETLKHIIDEIVVEKCAAVGDSDEEYEQVKSECQEILDEVLGGFDEAKGNFGEAKGEYKKIVPPTDFQPTPEEKMVKCDGKSDECDALKEKYKVDFEKRINDAIKNDKGNKKFSKGVQKHQDGVFEGAEVINNCLDQIAKDFEKTKRPEERDAIADKAIAFISDEADRIFDPTKGIFMEAEDLLDDPNDKTNCRNKLDEVDASKAQMMENIKIKIAELKAASGEADELTPEELLQLYHDASNKIIGLLKNQDVVDEGIPADPKEIRDRLGGILDEVNNIFGAKDTLRAKAHASVDEVFDRHGLP